MANYYYGNFYLTKEQQQTNALVIYNYLKSTWTMQAIAGLLGNLETESTVNPAIWQNLTENPSNGYGLCQWTPSTKLTEWLDSNGKSWTDIYAQLDRLGYEEKTGEQYYATSSYPLSFAEFRQSTETPYYLGMAWLYNYERPADLDQPNRGTQAEEWYNYLLEHGVDTPTPTPQHTRFKWYLYLRRFY